MSRLAGPVRLERRQPGERPAEEVRAVPGGSSAATLLALQRTVGNARLTRMIQRDEIPLGDGGGGDSAVPLDTSTGGGGAGATVGVVGGRRPAVRPITQNFADCNAAADWLNRGGNAGDASPQYHPTAGAIRHSSSGGTVSAQVDLTWAYDPSSTADMIIPDWPHMTDPERAAVARYRAAIQAHEEMHFDITDNIIKGLQRTVSATGSDQASTMAALRAAVAQYGADAQTALDTATHDYDTTTAHGANQSAVGGVDVHLDCSGGGGSGSGSSGSGGSSGSSSSADANLAADLTGL
jgi:hypothetical protein